MTDDELRAILAEDGQGILSVKPLRTPQDGEEERLLEKFREIVQFVEKTGAAPTKSGTAFGESILFARLEALRRQPKLRDQLLQFDEYGLLTPIQQTEDIEPAVPASIDDILNDKLFAALGSEADSIFDIKHIPLKTDVEGPDYVAQRKPCLDFVDFEEQFVACQAELKAGKRKLLPFANEQQVEAGKYFVLRGVLLLVSEIGERLEKNGKKNARLRCIFENGTESDMLLRSLSSELYKDGKRVTEVDDVLLKNLVVTDDDKASGFIYVLRSLSDHPDVTAVPNLYKIGLARTSIEGRIQNAANEPTYLRAPVAIVSTFQCFNVNLPKMENLIHRFFDEAAARIQVKDDQGTYFTPKEWFSVPLEKIEVAVRLLISGEIVNYVYDSEKQEILLCS